MDGTKIMLVCFVAIGVAIGAAIMGLAAAEVTYLQRLVLSSIPIAVSALIAWLAWPDGVAVVAADAK